MSEQINIPRILRDREGPGYKDRAKEHLSGFREKASEKIGHFIADITFDKDSIATDKYDEGNPDKLFQDAAFATYEPNLRETHYQEQREKREYYIDRTKLTTRKIGAIAMIVPGLDLIGKKINSRKVNKGLQAERRRAYKKRNGTIKSNLRRRYIDYHNRFDASTAGLKEHRRSLGDQKRQRKNNQ